MAGYSKRPLAAKLGIKTGYKLTFINHPDNYAETLGKLPESVLIALISEGPLDFIQYFVTEKDELIKMFPILKKNLLQNGMLWISWPKGGSKIKTDLNENIIRDIGLQNGLVDVKVIAVDDDWSGLKFVYRIKDRK